MGYCWLFDLALVSWTACDIEHLSIWLKLNQIAAILSRKKIWIPGGASARSHAPV